jgi:hypothetical protein
MRARASSRWPSWSATSASRCSAHRAADGAVQPCAFSQVFACVAQVAGQPLGLAAQRHTEGVAARGAQPQCLGRQGLGEVDDVGVGSRAVQEALGDAEVAVEDTQRQMRHLAGLVQVGPDTAMQVAARMRSGGLRP